jgi:adenosylcobinamide kinase/adenosylcobinamide-phosphate guanylyltransferase
MIILILGPNLSGKSAYAEKLAARLSEGALYYIATMIPYGDEGRERVEKHRKQRAAMGFVTAERPSKVSGVHMPPGAVALLEDVSNLLGNAMFAGERDENEDGVFADIAAMCAKCRASVLVSISGSVAAAEHDDETRGYIDALNRLNDRLADFADTVVTMRGGMPYCVKGDAHVPA